MTQPQHRPYEIEIKPSALKSLARLPTKHRRQVENAIDMLADDPRPHGVQKMQGEETLYRIYSGTYRIVYDIFDTALSICVVRIGHRKDVYRNL